ncbi:MAG: cytochrome c oxidase subunit 3 [Porticoccaceae bacterium]|nr:cytochrome c oxidase subunit 3 [Pseudomonadales bacterium]MCP5172138.1 cytochrome c oxidase subunit 3 [Pseudomonadales bacterium]
MQQNSTPGAEQYSDRPLVSFANKGVWIFVGIDLAIFSLFFLVFLTEKVAAPDLFGQSQQSLNATIGFVNTIILITSSWLLVQSLRAMGSCAAKARLLLAGSMLFGLLFVAFKLYEYYEKFSAGISLVENTFFTFYFLLTFIHFCHVIGGLIALLMVFNWLKSGADKRTISTAESIGIYWHMVDLLWIYLFLVLYLLR